MVERRIEPEERIQTLGILDVHGERVRITYTRSGVELDFDGETHTFLKEQWQEVVEASVSQWGRQLHAC